MSFSLKDLQEKQRRDEQREYESSRNAAVVSRSDLSSTNKKKNIKKKKESKWERLKKEKEEKARMERHLARKFLQRSGRGDEDYLNKVGYVTIKAKEVAQDNTLENVRKAKARLLKEGASGGGWKKVEPAPVVKKRARQVEPESNEKDRKKKKKRRKIPPFSKDTAWIEIRQSDGSSYYWNTLTDETRKKGDLSEWKYSNSGALLNEEEEESDDSDESGSESGSDEDGSDEDGSGDNSSSEENEEKEEEEQEEDKPAVFSFSFKKPTKGGPTAAVFQ